MSDGLFPQPKTAAPPLVVEKYDRCATCQHAQRDLRAPGAIICFGAPPTPVITGMTAQGPQIDALRPMLKETERACAVYKKKSVLTL